MVYAHPKYRNPKQKYYDEHFPGSYELEYWNYYELRELA